MKKYLVKSYITVMFVVLGTGSIVEAEENWGTPSSPSSSSSSSSPVSKSVGSKTTSENRGSNQLVLAGNTDQLGILKVDMIALNSMIAQASNQPTIAKELLKQAKKHPEVMKALLGKLENSIKTRDGLLTILMADKQFINLFNKKYAKKFPKTARALKRGSVH